MTHPSWKVVCKLQGMVLSGGKLRNILKSCEYIHQLQISRYYGWLVLKTIKLFAAPCRCTKWARRARRDSCVRTDQHPIRRIFWKGCIESKSSLLNPSKIIWNKCFNVVCQLNDYIVKGHGSVRTHQSNAESQGDSSEIQTSLNFIYFFFFVVKMIKL